MEREFQIHRTEEDYALAEFYKWALAFLIGVAMGCIGFIVDWGIETLNDFKYYHTVSLIASRGASQNPSAFAGTSVCVYCLSLCKLAISNWGMPGRMTGVSRVPKLRNKQWRIRLCFFHGISYAWRA